ncbi:PAS domain S-box protein [Aquiflexum sp. LQ15W]|uniref:PAS domain S-box protein n=1 Tax=Cognataquiflexum nitidum TaxID=2922272 RepID=UPI001F143568|nr:PAS domain S-box protein [Cognataquiflexum nitidum]MCH6198041.1 PAS domain S-box protein [Cognataquiflexum nitidum]
MKNFFQSLTFRIWFPFALVISLLLFSLSILYPNRQEILLRKTFEFELDQLTKATMLGVRVALNNNDFNGLSEIMSLVNLKASGLEFAAITEITEEGIEKVFVSDPLQYPQEIILNPNEDLFLLRKEKISTEYFEGYVILAVNNASIEKEIFEINYPVFIFLGILLILSLGIFFVLANQISSPISYLTGVSNELKTGKYDSEIKLVSNISEISDLNFSLLDLKEELKKARAQNVEFNKQLEDQIQIRTEDLEKTTKRLLEAQNFSNLGDFEIDLDTGIWACSPIVDRIFNIPKNFPRKNFTWKYFLSKENQQIMVDLLDKAIASGQNFSKDFKIQPFNFHSSEKWISITGSPVKNGASETRFIKGTIQDITERKNIENEVEKLSLVAKRTSNSVVITDLDFKIQWVNDAFLKLSGYSMEELKGNTPKMFQFEKTDKKVASYIKEQVFMGKDVTAEVLNRGKYGNEYWLQLNIVPLREDSGEIRGYMALETDITELKIKDEKIQRQVELQNILIDISSTYINIDVKYIEITINSSLEKLAKFVEADRAYIFDYNLKDFTTSNTYEWCAQDILPEIENLQNVPLEYIPDWLEQHSKKLPMIVPDVLTLPIAENEELNLRSILEPQGIKSLVTIPMYEDDTLVGFLGFDSVQKKRFFAEEEVKLLTLFGQMLINVRQRQKFQKRLQVQEEKYRNIIANMNLGFLEVDTNDIIQNANQSFCKMSGFNLNEMVGKKGIDLFFGNDQNSKKIILKRNLLRATGKSDVYEIEVTNKFSEKRYWLVSGGPNFSDAGEFIGSIGIHLDITEKKKLENEQQILLNLTQNQNERLKNFAHIVSHNLRSHAANLSGMISFMEVQSQDFVENLFFQNFKNVIDNLMESIQNLSEVAEIQTNDKTKMEKIDLADILKLSLSNVSGLVKTSGVTINYDQQNEPITVLGNASYLESITLNLLTNAIKYRDPEKNSEVEIKIEVVDDLVHLKVIDNGLGIDLNRQRRKIFGMYKTFHDHPDARGIGLFITKNQVEALGGKIEVESEEGKGSVFTVSLKKFKDD